jgi:hypothetical protein
VKIIAKIISILFHPLLIPSQGTALLLYLFNLLDNPEAPRLMGVVVFNSFVMPAIAIAVMKGIGFINSFEMHDSRERIIPFIATMVFYIWTFLGVKSTFSLGSQFNVFIMGAVISLMVAFFTNLFHKLSIHMTGMGGLLMALILSSMSSVRPILPFIILVILLSGVVGSARLYLKAHTRKELFTGLLVGVFGQMAALNIYHLFLR